MFFDLCGSRPFRSQSGLYPVGFCSEESYYCKLCRFIFCDTLNVLHREGWYVVWDVRSCKHKGESFIGYSNARTEMHGVMFLCNFSPGHGDDDGFGV